MPHIHTEPGHFDHTVSAYIFRTDTVEPTIMLHRHKKLNVYLQFGGHVELHETPWQTLKHELLEESGYELAQLQLLQPPHPHLLHKDERGAAHPLPFTYNSHKVGDLDHYHTDAGFAFITNQRPVHPVSDGESTHIRLFTKSEILAMPEHKIRASSRAIILHGFSHVVGTWQPVDPTHYHA